ncbi:head completion protein [uncultured Caudovirales phage]|uniref:Head completion nuclease n=1 Tax=uncultured Caudovirales phage TaxID=2100421 RepID=A0A6J5L4Z2_9CAUD|nr:head completion protein [uncultured Caudovirales phage]
MTSYAQGEFVPKNPEKYSGKGRIKYRSSWEMTFMSFCDNHPGVVSWASESLQIPYFNPVTAKQTIYVPDFLVIYVDRNDNKHGEVIEIKPSKETMMENAKSQRDKLMVAINMAKWRAASLWCKQQGLVFRILTEHDLFVQGKRR